MKNIRYAGIFLLVLILLTGNAASDNSYGGYGGNDGPWGDNSYGGYGGNDNHWGDNSYGGYGGNDGPWGDNSYGGYGGNDGPWGDNMWGGHITCTPTQGTVTVYGTLLNSSGSVKDTFSNKCNHTFEPIYLNLCQTIIPGQICYNSPNPPMGGGEGYGDPLIYVVPDGNYPNGADIPTDVTEDVEFIPTILLCSNVQPVKIWDKPQPGSWMVIFDVDLDGKVDSDEILGSLRFDVSYCPCGITTTTTTTTSSTTTTTCPTTTTSTSSTTTTTCPYTTTTSSTTTTTLPQEYGHLKIFKFNDYNANGIWEMGEPTLAGFQFNVVGPITFTKVTDQWGEAFAFQIPYGTYTITETHFSGWAATTSNPQTIVINSPYLEEAIFGNRQTPGTTSTTSTTMITTTTTTSTTTTIKPTTTTIPSTTTSTCATTTTTEPSCQMMWWYDNNHLTACQQSQFCGSYMYQGLHTYATQQACVNNLQGSMNLMSAETTTTTVESTTTSTLASTTTTSTSTTSTTEQTTTTSTAATTTTTAPAQTNSYPQPVVEVNGQIKIVSGGAGIKYQISGPKSYSVTTDSDGEAYAFGMPAGTYTITEDGTGATKTVKVKNPVLITVSF